MRITKFSLFPKRGIGEGGEQEWRRGYAKFEFQRVVGHLALLPFCGFLIFLLRVVCGYRIENLEALRREFREVTATKGPLLICSNHLTFIDSALIIWALAPLWWYFFHYSFFSWNLPASDVFRKKIRYRIVAACAKCVFIRRGPDERLNQNEVLNFCRYALEKGEVVTIFPEGRRSRTGRFEPSSVRYGTGKMLATMRYCRVLCVYIRGNQQETYSNYPKRGSTFHIATELVVPYTREAGREAYADLVQQISAPIKRMEDEYFASREPAAPGRPAT